MSREAEAVLDGDREAAVALLLRVGELIEANRRLEARVAELERRLKRNSQSSLLPPSQDPPSASARWRAGSSSPAPGREDCTPSRSQLRATFAVGPQPGIRTETLA
jgi:hypothetical protein